MKKTLITILFFTAHLKLQTAHASTYHTLNIPMGHVSVFGGAISDELGPLKIRIIDAAITVCQGFENIEFIGRTNISFQLSSVSLYNSASSEIFGSYLEAGATVDVSCQ